MGSFVNRSAEDMNQSEFQLMPLPSSITMFNTIREMINEPSFIATFPTDAHLYTSSNRDIRKELQELYGMNFSISQEGGEYLDGVGNYFPRHTLRLIEALIKIIKFTTF